MTASCTADSAAVCKVGVEMVESNFFLRILFARYRGTKTTTTESHVAHLLESYNEAFDKGKMSISQRRGIISLIPKGENSRSFSMIFSPHRITTSTEVEIWNFHITNEKVYL